MAVLLFLINTIGIYLLEFLLNENWENLRLFTLILSFLILARTTFNPISSIMIVLNKNHISLYFNIYLLSINLAAIFIGYYANSIIYTIVIVSIFGGLGYLFLLTYFLKILKKIKRNHEKNNII